MISPSIKLLLPFFFSQYTHSCVETKDLCHLCFLLPWSFHPDTSPANYLSGMSFQLKSLLQGENLIIFFLFKLIISIQIHVHFLTRTNAFSFFLKSNMHNIKFTIWTLSEYTVQWHGIHSHCCAIHLQNLLIIPNWNGTHSTETPHPLSPGPSNQYPTFSMVLTMLGPSCKWNHIIFVLLHLAYSQ